MRSDGVKNVLDQGISNGAFCGGVYAFGNSNFTEMGACGRFSDDASSPIVTDETLYDLASLTKVIATTSLSMKLYEAGELNLDRPVSDFLPSFSGQGKEPITPRHLLLHESGLIAFRDYELIHDSREKIIQAILNESLHYSIGQYEYSCVGFIVLMQLIEEITKMRFDQVFSTLILNPLVLKHTNFSPDQSFIENCAPTEYVSDWRRKYHIKDSVSTQLRAKLYKTEYSNFEPILYIQGEVHDERAAALGGVSGNAGLFSNIKDLAQFAKILLRKELVLPAIQDMFTTCQSQISGRGLGWDTRIAIQDHDLPTSSAGRYFSRSSFGHLGFTGTSMWIDPDKDMFAVLLTNRVHPSRARERMSLVRTQFADAVAKSLGKDTNL